MNPVYRYDIEQGTPEWRAARAGIPTGSMFDVLTTSTGKESNAEPVRTYMAELIAERIDPPLEDGYSGGWAGRGRVMEAQAREWYELINDVEVKEVGIVYRDADEDCACSPDGLVDEDGGVEIKCLKLSNHIKALLDNEVPKEHLAQCHANMWVTGRKWWDFISFHPLCRSLIIRVHRDEPRMMVLDMVVPKFIQRLNEAEAIVRQING